MIVLCSKNFHHLTKFFYLILGCIHFILLEINTISFLSCAHTQHEIKGKKIDYSQRDILIVLVVRTKHVALDTVAIKGDRMPPAFLFISASAMAGTVRNHVSLCPRLKRRLQMRKLVWRRRIVERQCYAPQLVTRIRNERYFCNIIL